MSTINTKSFRSKSGDTTTNGKSNGQRNVSATGQQITPIPTVHPTNSYIPTYLSEMVPELSSYQELLEAEKMLDIYLARKKIDLYQSVSQWNNSKQSHSAFSHFNKDSVKYLRVFISNIAENQPWQTKTDDLSNASWTMRIEGRLLDLQKAEDSQRPKFSSFIQDIAVDFKKTDLKNDSSKDNTITTADAENDISMTDQENSPSISASASSVSLTLPLQPTDLADGVSIGTKKDDETKDEEKQETSKIFDAVEWHFDPKNPVEFDGLDIKRNGSENIECTITIQPKGFTGAYLEYSKELSSIIGRSEGSLHEAVYSLYKYILINNLLINNESTLKTSADPSSTSTNGEKIVIQLDDTLQKLLPKTNSTDSEKPRTLKLSQLPPLVNTHISPVNPIKLNYTIRVDKASTYGELAFDIEVPTLNQKHSMDDFGKEGLSLVSQLDKLTSTLKPKLDELDKQTNTLQLQLNAGANKYQFFSKLADDPVPVLQEYMASSANALKVLSGDEGFNEDTVRRANFYKENEAMLFENIGVLLANGRI